MEVASEGMRHLLGTLQRPRAHDPFRLPFMLVSVARADHRPPQGFDVLEQAGSAVVLDHPSELLAEHAHVATQLIGDRLASRSPGRRQLFVDMREGCAYSNESRRAASDASMMLREQPTVVHRF